MTERTHLCRMLVLHGPTLESRGILDFLAQHFDLQIAKDLDSALDAMRGGGVQAVLAETGDFLPLERGIVSQHASVVLDRIGDGVCIVGAGGELVWRNRRLDDLPPEALQMLLKKCVKAYEQFASESDNDRAKRFTLMPDDRAYYEVICSPVRDRNQLLRQVIAVVIDSTSQRRLQQRMNAIHRAGKELVRLEENASGKRDAAERLRLIEERIIRCSRDVLDFQNFIVLVLDQRTNRLEELLSEGLGEDVRKMELFASSDGNGICGYVAATGQSYICHDVTRDPRYARGLQDARSSLTVPLRLHDKVVGVLNVESTRVGAFREEDRQFAEIFGNYVAMALNILNLLACERHTVHEQLRDCICTELAGPLSDIITEASEIKEDYIGLDDLRGRLDALIDSATKVRQSVHQLAESPRTGVLGVSTPSTKPPDPVLAGKKVLVADDEQIIRETIRDVLTGCGCIVDEAPSGDVALALLDSNQYDLIISDIKMPGATGYDIFETASKSSPPIPVILVTAFGYDPHHSVVRAHSKGLAAVLLKPFKVKQLIDRCRAAVS